MAEKRNTVFVKPIDKSEQNRKRNDFKIEVFKYQMFVLFYTVIILRHI